MNKICALIMLYNGRELSEIDAKRIVYEMQIIGLIDKPDDVTLVYKDADSIAKAIIAQEEHDEKNNNDATTLHFVTGPNKLQVVKFLKEHFHLSPREAKEAADTGVITVNSIDYPVVLKGLCKLGGYAKDLSDDIALQQAVIYINERYPNARMDKKFLSTFIKDVLDAKDKHDDFSLALVESVRLISDASQEECMNCGLCSTLYGDICVAYNVLASM